VFSHIQGPIASSTWLDHAHLADLRPAEVGPKSFWEMRPALPSPAAPGAGPLTPLQFP
jgi:hypothetical protein